MIVVPARQPRSITTCTRSPGATSTDRTPPRYSSSKEHNNSMGGCAVADAAADGDGEWDDDEDLNRFPKSVSGVKKSDILWVLPEEKRFILPKSMFKIRSPSIHSPAL